MNLVGFSYVWVIDQVCGQDGWILVKFLFSACLWTETESRSINSQKKNKEQGQHPAILAQPVTSIC